MAKSTETQATERKLNAVLETLRAKTNASRTTLRIDDAARGWNVNDVCAEALEPGMASLRGQTSIDQRAAATVKWLEANRRNLVQPDFTSGGPSPPAALMKVYAVKAQMLGPLFTKDGFLQGWLSVHDISGPRPWTDAQVAALDEAAAAVRRLTGIM